MLFSFIFSLLDLFGFIRKGQPQTGHVRRVFIVLELWQNNRDEKVLLIARELWFLYHSMSYAVADIG